MSAVPYGDRAAWVDAIVAAIKQGGLFAVDVDIVPTKIGQACHVWLPAATAGEMNLTSMNGERRMRLTERYMDPPGQAMPDCLIAARIANHLERVLREQGKNQLADQFKGFDWKTEEDAFMDGYAKHEKGGEFVTYARLRMMGTNGFQEPAMGLETTNLGKQGTSTGTPGEVPSIAGARGKEPVQKDVPSQSGPPAPAAAGTRAYPRHQAPLRRREV
jgi:arsenite oxidase large subunit